MDLAICAAVLYTHYLAILEKSQCVHESRQEARSVFRARANWHENSRGTEAQIKKGNLAKSTPSGPVCLIKPRAWTQAK